MKKIISVTLILLILSLFTGCSFSLDSNDIMFPPKPIGDQASIQKLINTKSNGKYQLIYPNNGSIRNSIITTELSENKKIAVAFYLNENDSKNHIMFLINNANNYEVLEDIKTDSTKIDRIAFADIDGDNVKEILIGLTYKTITNTLSIYKITEVLEEIPVSCEYTTFITGDFNRNRIDDILSINLSHNPTSNEASLYTYNNNEIGFSSSCNIDSDIKKDVNLIYGMIDSSNYGAILDAKNNNNEYTTQIIYFDKLSNSLKNPLYDYQGYSQTRRTSEVFSQDIDKDNIIEIPVCSNLPALSEEETSKLITNADWKNFDTTELVLVSKKNTILSLKDGYMLTIPDIWQDSITAKYDIKNRETTIYVWEYIDGELSSTDPLLTIKTSNIKDNLKPGFIEITRTNSFIYSYSIPDNDNYLLITGDEVKNNFALVSNK